MTFVKKKSYQWTRAMAVTAFACFVFWALAQKAANDEQAFSTKVLLDRLQMLYDQDRYPQTVYFADSIAAVFEKNGWRTDWYKVIRLRTIAQKEHYDARAALLQLLPTLQTQSLDDSITAKLYGLAGFASLNAGDFDQGAWYYEQCLAGLLRHRCKMGIGTAYMNIGYALKEQGDYRAARQYYLTALPLLRAEGNLWNLSESLINLGDISRYISDYEAAPAYYREAVEVYPGNAYRLPELLGWTAADQGRYREALASFKESCRQTPCAADAARIMGHCYEALGNSDEADRQYRLALSGAKNGPDSARAQWYIGQTLLRRRQPDAALQAFQQGLHGLFPGIRPNDPRDNPVAGLSPDFWPAALLRGKAESRRVLYAQSGDPQHLQQARADVSAAMAVLDTLRAGLRNEGSGQDAVDYTYGIYETGIRVALELDRVKQGQGYLAEAYDIAERVKSNALKTNLLEKDIRKDIRLPDSLLWQEKAALSAIAFWEEAGRPDSLLAATRRLEQIRTNIAAQIPLLNKVRAQTQTVSVSALQNTLQNGELLLQYFWGDSAVVVFAIGKQQMQTHTIARSSALDRMLDSLRSALVNWHTTPGEYAACAAQAYRRFCAPALESAATPQRLIIMPDGPLWAVPFEALTTGPDGRFLLENCAVSYHWSGALWQQSRTQEHPNRSDAYGGFAPQYPVSPRPLATMGAGLGDLPEARAAVQAAGADWGGRVWQGPMVDKSLFQREAGRFGVLHLAMHGLLDKNDRTRTGLVFPGDGDTLRLLNILEISLMDLSAQLAVLSACNTGSGVVYRGEGVMSLSRAFALAGCPAITANLWEVPSRETNDITAAFLDLLHDGQPKDAALRAAKLDFLNRAEPERRHPYFWAGQVLVGNEQPLRRSLHWGWWALGILVVALGWLGWRRWSRSRR